MALTWGALHLSNPLVVGKRVREAQTLLAARGYLHSGDIDGQYGPVTAGAVRAAKWKLGYRKRDVNTTFGPVLHAYLTCEAKPSPAMRARALARRGSLSREARGRKEVVRWAKWFIKHTSQISYTQGSARMSGIGHPGRLPLDTDCSASSTIICNWAGVPDPNGLGYNGTGFTGTMLARLKPITRRQVKPADFVFYGSGSGDHVCVVIEAGADPLLESHGQDAGPIAIRHSVELAAQERMHGGVVQVRWASLPRW